MRVGAVLLVVAVLLFLWPAIGLANPPVQVDPVPIEGTLILESYDGTTTDLLTTVSILQGSSDNVLPLPAPLVGFGQMAPSPLQDLLAMFYSFGTAPDGSGCPTGGEIYAASLDGTNLTDLTGPTGLGDVNCGAAFSPDGTRLLFNHFIYIPGLPVLPCEAEGAGPYLINVDGTGLRPVEFPPGSGLSSPNSAGWLPDGRIIVRGVRTATGEPVTVAMDADGVGNITDFPYTFPYGGMLSRDQQWVAYHREEWTDTDFTKLTIAERIGTGETRELTRFTLSFDDMQAVYQAQRAYADAMFATPEEAWSSILSTYGLRPWMWSPSGDRLLLIGVDQYDPQGAFWGNQIELFIYDLDADTITQITDNEVVDLGSTWEGFNTFPDHAAVTVSNTTVAFEDVTSDGLTNILVNSLPPALPSGEGILGFVYEIKTTCTPSGTITVEMTYLDEDIPTGTVEADLSIYHYDTDTSTWEDITVSRDLVNNVITGVTDSLSPFAMTLPQEFSDVAFSHWALDYILACVNAGIVSGYPDGTYRPTLTVTRDQMAVFISRALAEGMSWFQPARPPRASRTCSLTTGPSSTSNTRWTTASSRAIPMAPIGPVSPSPATRWPSSSPAPWSEVTNTSPPARPPPPSPTC